MKVCEIINTSQGTLVVDLEDGKARIAPGCGVRNVRINEEELKRIRSQVSVKLDLTEVKGLLD